MRRLNDLSENAFVIVASYRAINFKAFFKLFIKYYILR